jgi:hypothetical protein
MEMEVDGGGPRRNRKNDGARNGGGLVRNWLPEPEERRSSERWRARAKHLVGTGRMMGLETVAGSCESGCRNRKNDTPPNGGRRWEDFGGRWRAGGRQNLGGRQK